MAQQQYANWVGMMKANTRYTRPYSGLDLLHYSSYSSVKEMQDWN